MPVSPFRLPGNFNNDISAGKVDGYSAATIIGLTLTVAAVPADVWHGAGSYTGQPTSNVSERLRISSDNIADALNGAGAHLYRITGLLTPESVEFTNEFVLAHPTDGTQPVYTTNKFYRVTRVLIATAGASAKAIGDITCKHDITVANVFAVIPSDFNISQIAVYTVPANCELMLLNSLATIRRAGGNLSGSAVISINVRAPGGVYQSFFTAGTRTEAPTAFSVDSIGAIPAGSDIKYTVREITNPDIIVTVLTTAILKRLA